jgi:Zn-dependent M28 family amino/carboxypeptidase
MFRRIVFTALLVPMLACHGQDADSHLVKKYMKTITSENLKQHVYAIAADSMQGRDTGSEGQKKAARYLIAQYKSMDVPFPDGASGYSQFIPASYLNAIRDEHLPDSENIWAFIRGSENPDEIVVVSAHYDHVGVINGQVYNGADDDASGTATLLEVAQAFADAKREGHGPKRSLLFIHMTGEEHGLHGSRYYSEHPLFPLKQTIADVNIDMIGRHDTLHDSSSRYIYVIGSGKLSSDLYNDVRQANAQYENLSLDYTYDDDNDPNRFYYRSDHYNFAKNGIPSVFLFSGVHADYHQPGDDPQKIEYRALRDRARLAFALVWKLANDSQRPAVDKKP